MTDTQQDPDRLETDLEQLEEETDAFERPDGAIPLEHEDETGAGEITGIVP